MARIETEAALREIYRPAAGRAVDKQLDRLETHCRRFIELSPFLVISSQGPDGLADVSPKGDAPGFVQVLDDKTVAIPDRPGNNRLDTFTNLMSNPAVGLLFLIPGVDEILRINGTAEVRDDDDLRQRFAVDGKLPATVVLVTVREAYLHCAKALMRSRLWDPDAQVDRSELPSMGRMLKDQIGHTEAAEDQDVMVERYRKVLY
jgi:PPOX class probable FMN-dependent enzyme